MMMLSPWRRWFCTAADLRLQLQLPILAAATAAVCAVASSQSSADSSAGGGGGGGETVAPIASDLAYNDDFEVGAAAEDEPENWWLPNPPLFLFLVFLAAGMAAGLWVKHVAGDTTTATAPAPGGRKSKAA